jgi:REP element-mobilizing transposase RayT
LSSARAHPYGRASEIAMSSPLAYLITFTTYGTWLHGDDRGSADRDGNNRFGDEYLSPVAGRQRFERSELIGEPYLMDEPRRTVVLSTVREVCAHRGWHLHAAHVRSNHLHVVVSGNTSPERMMNDFKTYASRRLNQSRCDPVDCRRWTRHGSTRYLWTDEHLHGATRYVVDGQGESMAVFDGRTQSEEGSGTSPPLRSGL